MLARTLVSLLTLFTIVACGGSGSGSGSAPLTPLTPEQKGKVQNVTESMNAAQGAASQGRGAGLNGMLTKQVAFTNATGAEKTRQLGQKLQESRCDFDNQLPIGGTPDNGAFHLKVGGPTCPIKMEMSQLFVNKTTQNAMDLRQEQSISYAVTRPDFAQLNDVTAIEFKGALSGHFGQNGGSMAGRFEGYIQSQQYGRLPLLLTVSANVGKDGKGTTVMTIAMTFPDFSAVGKVSGDANGGAPKYFVNDQEVTKKEFEDTFQDSKIGQ